MFLAVFLLAAGASLKHLYPPSGPACELPAAGRLEIGLGLDLRIVLKAEAEAAGETAAGDIEQILVLGAPTPWDWSSWAGRPDLRPPSLYPGRAVASARPPATRLVAR